MRESGKVRAADCGSNMQDLSGKSAPGRSSSKTSGGCSPWVSTSSSATWPRSGMMRNGRFYPLPPLVPRTIVKGCSLLPTPTVLTFTTNGYFLRSGESWASTSNLMMYLIGLEYGLTGRERMPRYRHTASPSFIEWMMGAPEGWTNPGGLSPAPRAESRRKSEKPGNLASSPWATP